MTKAVPRWMRFAGGALLVVPAFLLGLTGLGDWDTFHHLALGRQIVERGLFGGDALVFFPVGISPSWLASLAFYGAHRILGDAGPVLAAAALGASLFLVLWLSSTRPDAGPLELAAVLAALALALPLYLFRAVARPELFTLNLLALTLWAIRRHFQGDARLLWALPPLALAWTNLHQTVVLGAGLVLAAGICGAVLHAVGRGLHRELPQSLPPRRALTASGVGVAMLAAGMVNPAPDNPVRQALQFGLSMMRMSQGAAAKGESSQAMDLLKATVVELEPIGRQNWTTPLGLSFIALVALAALSVLAPLAARRVPRLFDLGVVVGFAAFGQSGMRFLPLAAVALAPIAATNLAEGVRGVEWTRSRRGAAALALALALAAIGWLCAGASKQGNMQYALGIPERRVPEWPARYFAALPPGGRLFNTFHFGGYLEWTTRRPVFWDGRIGVPPELQAAAFAGPAVPDRFAPLDARFRFDALLLMPTERVSAAQWSLVAFDDAANLYLRRDGAYAEQAARDEFRFARPQEYALDLPLQDAAYAAGVAADMQRALASEPRCNVCRTHLGHAQMALEQLDAARRTLESVGPPWIPPAHWDAAVGLALLAELRQDAPEARRRYREALELGLDDRLPRRGLAALTSFEGDQDAAWELLAPNLAGRPSAEDVQVADEILQDVPPGPTREARLKLAERAAKARDAEAERQAGLAAYEAKELRAAVEHLRAALALRDDDAPAHSSLGDAYADLGDLDAAQREQERAIALDPAYPEARYGLGQLLARRGDRAGAARELREYLRLEPLGDRSRQATEQLRALDPR